MYVAGFFGADQKRLETVKLLLEKYKAALTIKNNAGQTALMVHAICGAIDVFDYLIKEHNMTIDLATLVRCIAYEEVVFGMGSYGPVFNPLPFIDYCIKKLGLTAQAQPALTQDLAIAAVKKYNIDVIQRLCQKDCGFDINTQDAEGWTMLMHVCDSKYGNIFQKIIEEFKPNIYAKNNASKTAFDIAAQYGNTLILDYFIKNCGFTIETCDSNGLTPLHHAAANVNLGTLENLIRFYNANIHAKDNNGRTALMIVAGNHDTGAKCKARECDQEKSESSRWHRPKSHAEIAHYLIEHGIDINTVDNNGRTALMHAEAAGRKEVIEYLKTGKINNDSQKEPSLLFNPFDID
jgi:ankyrin repeat protein